MALTKKKDNYLEAFRVWGEKIFPQNYQELRLTGNKGHDYVKGLRMSEAGMYYVQMDDEELII